MIDFGKKCIILTRVSTTQQDYQFQLDALYKYADELGLDKPLTDISTKESGFRSMENKDGFKRVIDFLTEHDCRIVLCTELSRLAREKIVLEQIKEWFVKNKIQLYVKDQNFRLFNDEGEVDYGTDIIFSVYASLAQSEMREKKKRLSRGIDTLLALGYSVVGPTAFGYTKQKTTEKIHGKYRSILVVNEEQAEQIRTIFDWALNGINGDRTRCSARAIMLECVARGFDPYLSSVSNVKKCLSNEGYTGSKTTHNRRKNPEFWDYGQKDAPKYVYSTSHTIKYPPIISRKLFEAVQKRMYASSTHLEEEAPNVFADKSRKHVTILAKMFVCPVCGRFLVGCYRYRNGRLMAYYRCGNHHEGRNTNAMPLFDTAIWGFCKGNWETYMDFLKKSSGSDTAEIEKRMANIEQMIITKEKEKDEYLEQVLSLGRMSSKLHAKVKDKVVEYDKQIESYKSMLLKEKESLGVIKRMTDLPNTELAIEASKEDMRTYIQVLVKTIKLVYRSIRLCIIEVKLNNGVVVPYTTPEQTAPSSDVPVYLIVDGIQGNFPKLRSIYSPSIKFNASEGTFMYGDRTITMKEVFEDRDEEFTHELLFRRLKVYQEDVPKHKA